MYGSEYVVEHVIAEHNRNEKRLVYEVYATDVLMMIANKLDAGIEQRYYEFLQQEDEPVKEEKSGDEIALEVIEKAGLKGRT